MAEASLIAWTDSTFNPWIGCMKVSPGCDNCYAETLMDMRYGRVEWGQRKTDDMAPSVGTRSRTSPAYWRQPLTWNRRAAEFRAAHGRRRRVFCASLADVFDNQVDAGWRTDLWKLIWDTPDLDWLLLTKRPENIDGMLPMSWASHAGEWSHVWLGATCENQENYDRRWPILQRIPAEVRFISYEPAIGPLRTLAFDENDTLPDWLICGGESGRCYRDMPVAWANDIGWICKHLGVPFFMKQMAGGKPIPSDILVRQFPITSVR